MQAVPDLDDWADTFFDDMLHERLTCEQFEAAVHARIQEPSFVHRAPRTALRLRELARSFAAEREAGYGEDAPQLRFASQWLVGKPGRPGAVHIEAPPERIATPRLTELNRPPHCHDSGRLGLITSGRAVFQFVAADSQGRHFVVDCPVEQGDLVFWPAWTPHTFDAREGFSVLSAMAAYVSPREDGFVFPVQPDLPPLDTMERLPIGEFGRARLRLGRPQAAAATLEASP